MKRVREFLESLELSEIFQSQCPRCRSSTSNGKQCPVSLNLSQIGQIGNFVEFRREPNANRFSSSDPLEEQKSTLPSRRNDRFVDERSYRSKQRRYRGYFERVPLIVDSVQGNQIASQSSVVRFEDREKCGTNSLFLTQSSPGMRSRKSRWSTVERREEQTGRKLFDEVVSGRV